MVNSVEYEPSESMLALQESDRMGQRVRFDEPLSKHCSLRIGGPASVWAEVETAAEFEALLEASRADELPVFVVGLGSNSLFPDPGIHGVVVRLTGELAEIRLDERSGDDAVFSVGAGAVNAHVVRGLHRDDWVGAEFLALIPGTFGGAVVMNAGTKECELGEILYDADVLMPSEQGWERRLLAPDELALSYRHSNLPEGAYVLGGRIRVEKGDVEAARKAVRSDKERRNRTQPYKLASVGSTFANPEGDYAGRVIEEVGLKGHSIGGAQISELHANFFINRGEASSDDFLRLMALARHRVRDSFGLELRPEVEFVGFDGYQRMLDFERQLERQEC